MWVHQREVNNRPYFQHPTNSGQVHDEDLFMIFVDLNKPTPVSIDNNKLWTALRNLKISEKLVRMIEMREMLSSRLLFKGTKEKL